MVAILHMMFSNLFSNMNKNVVVQLNLTETCPQGSNLK